MPPYAVGFETANSVSAGNLNGQGGWTVAQGSATVTTAQAFSGANSVLLVQSSPPAQITHAFGAPASGVITYTDFFAQPNATWTIGESTTFEVEGSRIGLVRLDSNGQVLAWDGNGSGGGRWVLTGKSVAVNGSGQATSWTRFTIRQDYSAKKWDLYVDGVMAACDLGFRDNTKIYLSLFKLTAAASTDSYLDDFYVGAANPLFTDADNDGMEDAWETAHGLNPALDDRDADHDSDGVNNLEEYVLGTNPNAADSDADGLPDAWEIDHGSNPLEDDAATDPGDVGRTLLQSYTGSLNPWPLPTVASGLRAWYRADKGVTKDGTTNKVSLWTDVSGHRMHVGLPEEQSWWPRPVLSANAMNGHPAINFGSDPRTVLRSSGLVDLLGGEQDMTILVVVRPAATQGSAYGSILTSGFNAYHFAWDVGSWGLGGNREGLQWYGSAASGYSPRPELAGGVVQVLGLKKAGTVGAVYINGVLQGSQNNASGAVDVTPGNLSVGGKPDSEAAYDGQIAEILIYNRALTDTERQSIETVLMTKYINLDEDADGLPDAWEDQYLGTRSYGATDDPGDVGRTILQSYTGSLNPWPVPTVASGLRAWFRADLGVTKDGSNKVSLWTDVSGHGMHVGLSLEQSWWPRPVLSVNAMNGHPAINFGSDPRTVLRSPSLVDLLDGEQDMTILVVVKPAATQGSASGSILTSGLDAYHFTLDVGSWGLGGNHEGLQWYGSAVSGYSPRPELAGGAAQVLGLKKAGTVGTVYINGAFQGSQNNASGAIDATPGNLSVGGKPDSESAYDGQIAEILVYNRALTDTERRSIEEALAVKYLNISLGDADDDNDGLTNLQESTAGTNSALADTDGDGLRDGLEVAIGTDPLVADIDSVVTAIGNVRLHLRADLGVTLDGSNKVSDWADQSGLSNSATQSNAGIRPEVTSNALNGYPVINFGDANSGAFDLPNFMSSATQGEIFHVLRASPSTSIRRLWSFPTGPTFYPLDNGQIWDSFGSAIRLAAVPIQDLSQFHVYNARSTSGLWLSRINGARYFSSSDNTPAFGGSGTIQLGHVGGQNFGGDIAEIVAFDRVLTAAEREAVECYLNVRYQLQTAAPTAPTSLVADLTSSTQISLSWSGALAQSGITYEIERRLVSGFFARLAEVEDMQSYFDSVEAGKTYSYRVRARNAAGVSAFSSTATITTPVLPLPPLPVAGIRLWLKADALSGDGRVYLWPDVSGHGQDAAQGNTSQQPVRIANVVNGKPVVRFDGSNDRLDLPNFMAGATEGEVFAIVKPNPSASFNRALWFLGSNGAYFPLATDGVQGIQEAFGSTATYVGPPAPISSGAFALYNVSARSGLWSSRLNGTLYLAKSDNTVAFTAGPYLGVGGDLDIAEIIVYDHYLTEIERESVNAYLNGKYALGLAAAFDSYRDLNFDGLADGVGRQLGIDPTNMDVDGDGVLNATELINGTDPLKADTDGDGHADNVDAFPLDPMQWDPPSGGSGDTTPPTITLTKPTDAVLQP